MRPNVKGTGGIENIYKCYWICSCSERERERESEGETLRTPVMKDEGKWQEEGEGVKCLQVEC